MPRAGTQGKQLTLHGEGNTRQMGKKQRESASEDRVESISDDKKVVTLKFEKRSVVTRSQFVAIFEDQLHYQFQKNQVTGMVEFIYGDKKDKNTPLRPARNMTDAKKAEIRVLLREMDDAGNKSSDLSVGHRIHDVILLMAEKNVYHPVRCYLEAMGEAQDDGIDWLQKLINCMDTARPDITYAFLKRWLLGCIGRTFKRDQNYCLILQGPQGIGKSTFARWLARGLHSHCETEDDIYFKDGPVNPSPNFKDHQICLFNKWIWEIGEIDENLSKTNVSAFKNFMSFEGVSVRRPYGEFEETYPRLCNFIGGTNDGEFLVDATGNRRYLVIQLNSLDRIYSSERMSDMDRSVDVNGLWAQAMKWYLNGETFELSQEEKEWQTGINSQHMKKSPVDEWLRDNFVSCENGFITTEYLLAKMVEEKFVSLANRKAQMELADCTKRQNFVKCQGPKPKCLRGYRIKTVTKSATTPLLSNDLETTLEQPWAEK